MPADANGRTAVFFSEEEIDVAKRLHAAGLPWEPAAGHYVWDLEGSVQRSSPFQNGVYFVINYAYFMTLLEGVEAFKSKMVWLPTWEQIRHVASDLGISGDEVVEILQTSEAIRLGTERIEIYRAVLHRLEGEAPAVSGAFEDA